MLMENDGDENLENLGNIFCQAIILINVYFLFFYKRRKGCFNFFRGELNIWKRNLENTQCNMNLIIM